MAQLTPFWLGPAPLILASGSATRRTMLEAAGIPVETVPATVDERALEAGLGAGIAPAELALALARAKAEAVSRLHPGRLVLGADQVLSCGGNPIHKAADATALAATLDRLQGRPHELCSAFALVRDGEPVAAGSDTARLTMRPLSPAFIARYVAASVPAVLSSVGGYHIEGAGAQLFARIEGDHFTILGLPLLAVTAALRQDGWLLD